ncbi:uncharacterized protein LOC110616235 [Manihot esculenta]|uniref:Uncharacterized protein n=1 Tax=Manihot esculenta TaxID=3983 RepID=A0A2C9VZI9_MANES|nr:uncharacterized protein LOC110616235 [Manihot esculenta]OAY50988.1 hypothetical protein MANES_05G178500v8 [Manihot esculenta]
MAKGSSISSMKRHRFVSSGLLLLLLVLLLSVQISVVHCRALRSMTTGEISGCQQQKDVAHQSAGGVASFAVSSNNSIGGGGTSVSLMFQLASGPSRKGPGH